MTGPQIVILSILASTMAMFLWGRWRHDMVAAGALLACVFTGLVSTGDAFYGFAHPAVITVACVLILSKGLENSGAVDVLVRRIMPTSAGPTITIAALTGVAAVLSGFMNNIGALALMMPIALQVAARREIPPRARPHAPGLRLDPGRHDHHDRNAAQSDCIGLPRPKRRKQFRHA